MKKLMFVLLAYVLATATIVLSQDTPSQQDNSQVKQDNSQPQHSVSGKVSKDGKSFVSDQDSKNWKVSNPDVLKGHEGQQVMLVIQVDPANNEVHIVSLEPEPPPK